MSNAIAHKGLDHRPHIKSDEHFMQLAITQGKKNPQFPFGAVIVDKKSGKVLATGVNASNQSPTFHGEIVAINNCARLHPHLDWSKVTLYTTAEPCPMCQSAIIWAHIPHVVYATSIDYLSSHGWDQIQIGSKAVNKRAPFYKGTILGGVLASKTDPLFNKS